MPEIPAELQSAKQSLLDHVRGFAAVGLTRTEDGAWALALRQPLEAPTGWTAPTEWEGFPVDFAFIGIGLPFRA